MKLNCFVKCVFRIRIACESTTCEQWTLLLRGFIFVNFSILLVAAGSQLAGPAQCLYKERYLLVASSLASEHSTSVLEVIGYT